MKEGPSQSKEKEANSTSKVLAENIEVLVEQHRKKLRSESRSQAVIAKIAGFVGSVHFIYAHLILFGLWIFANKGTTSLPKFDPTLHFLAVFASIESLFLSGCVITNQNRMQLIADERSDLQLHISLLAEREATRLIRIAARWAEKQGIDLEADDDDDLNDLMQDVKPDEVLDEIRKRDSG
jgi:uncharacterized membrane protein